MVNALAASGSQTGSDADLSFNLKPDLAVRLAVVAENSVELLGDPDEGGPAAQLLQFACPDIGAGGADPTQDVSYCNLHWTFVENFDCLPLRRSGGKRQTQRRQCKNCMLRRC